MRMCHSHGCCAGTEGAVADRLKPLVAKAMLEKLTRLSGEPGCSPLIGRVIREGSAGIPVEELGLTWAVLGHRGEDAHEPGG